MLVCRSHRFGSSQYRYLSNGGLVGFLDSVNTRAYGDLRNHVARMRNSDYWTLTCTGKDVVVKRCRWFAPVKSAYTKALLQAEREIASLLDSGYREYYEHLSSLPHRLTYDAIRLRRKRLLDRLKAFVATSDYCYFFTITSRDGDFAVEKERFLYAFENARKHYQSKYGKMHYVGVLERHPKRNKHPFHAHFCAFFEGGYKRYEELWNTFGADLGRIHLEPASRNIRGLADYSYKSFLETITAYLNKVEVPESIMLSSKGSPKPVRKYPSDQEVEEMASTGTFESKTFTLPTGGEVSYMYSDKWSEIASIFKELSYLEKAENELLAEEFMQPQHPTHRR